ncbi:hypothetical protein IL306_000436 [Fusarium sp. DS 682]|nr:hypothetical protein IL306_000436 [Fusarium sp. DS 682]
MVRAVPEYLEDAPSKLFKSGNLNYQGFGPQVFEKTTGQNLSVKKDLPHLHHKFDLAAVHVIVDAAKDTTAGILADYRIENWKVKKVDYVFHIKAQYDDDSQAKQLIDSIRFKFPDSSINLTRHFKAHPIFVSVKTKKDVSNEEKARLQMGV